MAVPSVQQQLENNFPLRTPEELNHLRERNAYSFIKEKAVKRNEIVDVAYNELAKAEIAYHRFMDILHAFHCDIDDENSFALKFQGNTDYPPLPSFGSAEAKNYSSVILTEFNNGSYFVKEDLIKIRNQLIEAYSELKRQYNAYEKGAAGEEYVKKEIDCLKGKYKFLHNIRFASAIGGKKSCEIDTFIMTHKGLVVAETKNYGSEKDTFFISRDGQWVKNPDRTAEIIHPSPANQNTQHCLSVEALLKEHDIKCKLIPVILIANEYVKIVNENDHIVVLRPSELYNYIEQLPLPEIYNEASQDKIIKTLEASDLGDNTFKIKTFNEETDMFALTQEFMQYMSDMYKAAKGALRYKPKYPLSKTIGDIISAIVPPLIILGIIIFFIVNCIDTIILILGLLLCVFSVGVALLFFFDWF